MSSMLWFIKLSTTNSLKKIKLWVAEEVQSSEEREAQQWKNWSHENNTWKFSL